MKLIPVLALLCAFSAPTFAGPCVALEYQEMKDMSADDLVKEACKARDALRQSFKENELNRDTRSRSLPFPNAQQNFDQCAGQIPRIDRVLESKGIARDKVAGLCPSPDAGRQGAQ